MSLIIRVGKKLRHLRKKRGMTLEKLAEKAGLNPRFVGEIERGEGNATIKTLESICRALSVEPYQLFLVEDEAPTGANLKKALEKVISEADEEKLKLFINMLRQL